jgi:hypothetical protein
VKDADAPSRGAEMDVLKVYVWGMLGVTVVFAGLAWWWDAKEADLRKTVVHARETRLPQIAQAKRDIQGMLKVFKANKEDEARLQPLTWFSTIWKSQGINEASIQILAWKDPPEPGHDGSYVEEKITIKFLQRSPLRREQIGKFLHAIERSSTRLRVIEMRVQRAGRDESMSADEWYGEAVVGYRVPSVKP